jgi:hypothetical protein
MRWSRYPQLESTNKVTRAPLTNARATGNGVVRRTASIGATHMDVTASITADRRHCLRQVFQRLRH